MDKVTISKSKIPIVRHTRSSLLLSNLNNNLNNSNHNGSNNSMNRYDKLQTFFIVNELQDAFADMAVAYINRAPYGIPLCERAPFLATKC